MIIEGNDYFFISENSNRHYTYWQNDIYPEWSSITTFVYDPGQKAGGGVETHYHDCDEIWLFLKSNEDAKCSGEVWLDGKAYKITHNTIVYTPMGTTHRFQMFTDYDTCALVTRLEGKKRATHIMTEEHGLPEKTVPGFVVPGEKNKGPIADRGKRCPLTELRQVNLLKNEKIKKEKLKSNEYWVVLEGDISVKTEKFEILLSQNDVALLRSGLVRELETVNGCRLALARE